MLAGLYSCTKDENSGLQDEVDSLKSRLEAIEKGKTVISVEFKDTNMVITYSSGEKVTLPLPKGLDGINGANGKDGTNGTNGTNGTDGKDGINGTNGKDGINGANGTNGTNGVGIQNMVYDENTGILKITLTNGNVSEFKIVSSNNKLTAVLLSDVNGSYLLTNAYMGGLNLANITYNDQNQVAGMVNYVIADRQQVKSNEITNIFSNGKLYEVNQKQYVTETREYWDSQFVNPPFSTKKAYTEYRGQFITTPNGDGTYSIELYSRSYIDNGITKYEYTVLDSYQTNVVTDNQLAFKDFYYFSNNSTLIKLSDSQMIRPIRGNVYSSTQRSDGKWDNIIYCYEYYKCNFTSNKKVGDVIRTDSYLVRHNEKGLLSKIYHVVNNYATAEYLLQLTYDSSDKLVRSEKFTMNGTWVSTGTYLSYEYNATNQLIRVTRFNPDNTSEKIMETVYDKNGNPIEIYALQGAVYSKGWDQWYNPDKNQFEYGGRLIKPAGFGLVAKFEYDYQLKNFFGNSISAIHPLLDHYKVVNAIKRAWSADEYGMNGWITYQDYNEFGYPQSMILNGTNMAGAGGESGRLEIRLTYLKKK